MPSNRKRPVIDSSVDVVMGVQMALSPETTTVFVSRPIPPNRKKPVINPEKGLVVGAFRPTTLPGFMPTSSIWADHSKLNSKDSEPRGTKLWDDRDKEPVISKADIVMAVMDSMGTIVDNLAENLAGDLNNMLANSKLTGNPSMSSPQSDADNDASKGHKVMEGQRAVQEHMGSEARLDHH